MPDSLALIIRALRIESLGGDYRSRLHHDEPVTAWLRQSLHRKAPNPPRFLGQNPKWDIAPIQISPEDAA